MSPEAAGGTGGLAQYSSIVCSQRATPAAKLFRGCPVGCLLVSPRCPVYGFLAGLFHWNADVVPLDCRKPATKGVGCCVPLLTHLPSLCIYNVSLGQSGFLAPAPSS